MYLEHKMPGCSECEQGHVKFDLTGVSEKEKIVKALKLSPAGYVLKPVKQNKLLQVVEEVLDEKRPTEGINIEELLLPYGELEQVENSSGEVEI